MKEQISKLNVIPEKDKDLNNVYFLFLKFLVSFNY